MLTVSFFRKVFPERNEKCGWYENCLFSGCTASEFILFYSQLAKVYSAAVCEIMCLSIYFHGLSNHQLSEATAERTKKFVFVALSYSSMAIDAKRQLKRRDKEVKLCICIFLRVSYRGEEVGGAVLSRNYFYR